MSRFPLETSREDELLRELLQKSLAEEAPSDELRDRIAAMANAVPTVVPAKKRFALPRFTFALSAATVMFVVAAFTLMWPHFMTTQALARVEAAMAKVRTAHTVSWTIKDGKHVKEYESWEQKDMLRVEVGGKKPRVSVLYKNGKVWAYEVAANTLTVNWGSFKHGANMFGLSSFVASLSQSGKPAKVTFQGEETIHGHTTRKMRIEAQNDGLITDVLLFIDTETNLPMRGESYTRTRFGNERRSEMQFIFNAPLKASLFDVNFPRTAKLTDQADEAHAVQSIEKVLAAVTIGRRKVGEREIAIRNLSVNKRGSVFLLYTMGKRQTDEFSDGENERAGRDWKVSLTDSLGTRYHYVHSGEFNPNVFKKHTVEGARLEGDWWVPDTVTPPGQAWSPRTFFIHFEFNPRNLHGPRNSKEKFKADYSAKAQFKFNLSRAWDDVVPSLVRALDMGVWKESLLRQEAKERGELPPTT